MPIDLHRTLDATWQDGTRPKDLYRDHVSRDGAAYVPSIVAGLGAGPRRVQNGCAELASLLSEDHPELLLPHIRVFAEGLGSRHAVNRWEAVCTLGNLARVDHERVIPPLVPRIAAFLRDDSIVLQGHAARALGKIARAFPDAAEAILDALLAATDRFPGNRIGFVVEAMEAFSGEGPLRDRARSFVATQVDSEVNVVARKARRVLSRL